MSNISSDLRAVACEIVQGLPPDVLASLANLDREGKLDLLLNRILLQATVVEIASGVIGDMLLAEVKPLLRGIAKSASWKTGKSTASAGTAMTIGAADVHRSTSQLQLAAT